MTLTILGKRFTYSCFDVSLVAIYAILFGFASTSLAQQQSTSANPTAYECTQVALEDIDPALLTKEERIALLDNNLSDSIDNFSTCVGAAQQNMAAGGYGQGDGSGQGNGNEDGAISGTADSSATDLSADGGGANGQNQEGVEPPIADTSVQDMQPSKQSASAQRGVIPPKDNDKIICKLLFQEITNAQDPAMLKGLKEQYSNYKCG